MALLSSIFLRVPIVRGYTSMVGTNKRPHVGHVRNGTHVRASLKVVLARLPPLTDYGN